MNVKALSIVLAIVAIIIAGVFPLKSSLGNSSKTRSYYEDSTKAWYKGGYLKPEEKSGYVTGFTAEIEAVNDKVAKRAMAWAVACGIVEKGVKNSEDQGAIEREIGGGIKGNNDFGELVRVWGPVPNSDEFSIVTAFKKKESVKTVTSLGADKIDVLAGYESLDVSSLLIDSAPAKAEEPAAEAAEEPAPEQKAAKPAKGKKGKKAAPEKKSKKRGKKR